MKINKRPLIFLTLFLASCGGGSKGYRNSIEGTWRGDLFQGVIICEDGTGIGAGGGSVVRAVELLISGTDELGTVVQVIDQECILEGTREENGFRAFPVSGCSTDLVSIIFSLSEEQNTAGVSYQTNFESVTPGEVGSRCKITPSGTITR